MNGEIRLNKFIARSTSFSRRQADQIIQEGRVKIDGKTVQDLGRLVFPKEKVLLDQKAITPESEKKIVLFNKPQGVICSRKDPQGRKTILDCLPRTFHSLRPVGRLDYHSEGLVILTNWGDFAHRMLHPRFEVPRVYRVKVSGSPTPKTLSMLLKGIQLRDGLGKFQKIKLQKKLKEKTVLEVTVQEGRNRFVRRMFEAVYHPVDRLKRIAFGQICLGSLQTGSYLSYTSDKIDEIEKSMISKGS